MMRGGLDRPKSLVYRLIQCRWGSNPQCPPGWLQRRRRCLRPTVL